MEIGRKAKPILVVEDESIMRESLRDWLAEAGYNVETAEEGEKALKAIAERDFGLLILDLRLPGTGGIDLLRQARAKRPQLKGIIITAYPSVQTAVEAMKEGAVDYLTKPFDLNRLEESIRSTLGPVQFEIRPKVATDRAVAKPSVTVTKVDRIVPEAPEEIPSEFRNIGDKSALIQMLLAIQRENRWLSNNALVWVSQKLGVPLTQIYHIATFYKAFSLKPQGRHSVFVCAGTACHVRGATGLLNKVEDRLKIKSGQTSGDKEFTLNTVNCLGCCALGPVMMVDGKYHSNPSTDKVKEIFEACK
jgi:NADH:ubiquinone oxidoreductase subunit E/FixJ family two-component response regulator